jgi:hypothetical protein
MPWEGIIAMVKNPFHLTATAGDSGWGMEATSGRGRIDFKAIIASVDLAEVITALIGPPQGRPPKWPCPWHADGNPSLYLYSNGRRWRCWPCNATGDAIDFVAKHRNIGKGDAARFLSPTLAGAKATAGWETPSTFAKASPPPRAKSAPPSVGIAWKTPEWQAAAEAIILQAATILWGDVGLPAYRWLRSRGLDNDTIRRFRLGFLPDGMESVPLACLADAEGQPQAIRAPRGITIPWLAPGSWYSPGSPTKGPRWCGCNVRRLKEDVKAPWPGSDKCMAFNGSVRGFLYPLDSPKANHPVLIVEGEIDALLAWQELGWILDVVTVGSASTRPKPSALEDLSRCSGWLIAMDHDAAGDLGARQWRESAPPSVRTFRMWLPRGKDIGEFVQGGGDLRAWLASELVRIGEPRIPRALDDRGEAADLSRLLGDLSARGLRIDGRIAHPRIVVGTVTGRVVYSGDKSPVQTWPKADRLARISPVVPGRVFLRGDLG